MSLLLTTLIVGSGIILGRMIARSPDPKRVVPRKAGEAAAAPDPAAEKPVAKTPDLDAFPCRLGDVVLRSATNDEAWLAGALVLREGAEPAAVLFFAPEAGGDRAVLARPSVSELLWLVEEKRVSVALGEPPTALEIGSDRFERRRRLPLRAERVGTGAPNLDADVIFAEYTGLGDESLVVLATKASVLAYRGPVLGSSAYDVLPGSTTKTPT